MSQVSITVKDVFDEEFKDIVFDRKLIAKLNRFLTSFWSRDSQMLAFFGSNLIGVHVVRWRLTDTPKFFREVFDIDYVSFERAVKTITTISHDYVIQAEPMNLAMMYCIHRLMTAEKLTVKEREQGCYTVANLFFSRTLVLRQSDWFNFPADPKVALAAYNRLSNRHLIKRMGSWGAVIDYRAKRLIEPPPKNYKLKPGEREYHYVVLQSFMDDIGILYAVGDSENRIRDMYRNYFAEFDIAYKEGQRVQQGSATIIDLEGEEHLREKVKKTEQCIAAMQTVIMDPASFVNDGLIDVVIDLNTNTSYRMLRQCLSWLSDEASKPKYGREIDEWMRLTVMHGFYLIESTGMDSGKDLPKVLKNLKNLFLSTRSSDKDLYRIRELGDKFIKQASPGSNTSLAKATRTAMILYVVLRAIASLKL